MKLKLTISLLTALSVTPFTIKPAAIEVRDVKEDQQALNGQLIEAAISGDVAKLTSLIAAGADADTANNVGDTALIWAAYLDNIEIAKLLLEAGADANATNKINGAAPLILTTRLYRNSGTLKVLLEKGCNVNEANASEYNPHGSTALMFAAEAGKVEAIQTLLEQGANVNAINKNGDTALIYAALSGCVITVKTLLTAPEININASNDNGYTALMIAAIKSRNGGTVQALIDKGADVNTANNNGDTALMMAAINSFYKMAQANMLQALVDKGADVNATNNDGDIALALAIRPKFDNTDAVKMLVAAGSNINSLNKHGQTLFTGLARYSEELWSSTSTTTKIAKILLAAGTDIPKDFMDYPKEIREIIEQEARSRKVKELFFARKKK